MCTLFLSFVIEKNVELGIRCITGQGFVQAHELHLYHVVSNGLFLEHFLSTFVNTVKHVANNYSDADLKG